MSIGVALLNWYKLNARDLPWRKEHHPYNIWVSEIILQQTQMSRGVEYYSKFIMRFPEVHALAAADEQEVLLLWQGLGYYSRARNMLKCAKQIVRHYNGIFPDSYKELISLPGIGDYTACAVLSIAYNKPFVVVDGNVLRLITRLSALSLSVDESETVKLIKETAFSYMGKSSPALFNQAMMELGALICRPKNPDCEQCPLMKCCKAFSSKKQQEFPVRNKKTKKKLRVFHYFAFLDSDFNTVLIQRKNRDIWRNLWEFPMIENFDATELPKSEIVKMFSLGKDTVLSMKKIAHKKHMLTHLEIFAVVYLIQIIDCSAFSEKFRRINIEDISEVPVHNLMRWCYSNIIPIVDLLKNNK